MKHFFILIFLSLLLVVAFHVEGMAFQDKWFINVNAMCNGKCADNWYIGMKYAEHILAKNLKGRVTTNIISGEIEYVLDGGDAKYLSLRSPIVESDVNSIKDLHDNCKDAFGKNDMTCEILHEFLRGMSKVAQDVKSQDETRKKLNNISLVFDVKNATHNILK